MDEDANLVEPIQASDHQTGPAGAGAVLVEYGDYECPYCGAAYPIVKEVQNRLGDKMNFVFRDFPLTQIHAHAEMAAEAANEAGDHGKFWEYHDLLFEHQDKLDPRDLSRYAADLGLDVPTFERQIRGHVHLDRIRHDFSTGVESGVNGTPTFFINGVRYDGPVDAKSLIAALDAAT